MDLERIAQAIADCLSDGDERLWQVGDVLAQVPDQRGVLKSLAGMVGRSTAFLSMLRTASQAFAPSERAKDFPWKTHYICASTSRPKYWLEVAVRDDLPGRMLLERMIESGDKKRRKPKQAEQVPESLRGVIDAAWAVVRHGPELIADLRVALEEAGID